jgi:isoleucyl-tRNA synthetase
LYDILDKKENMTKKFNEYKGLNLQKISTEILKFWEESQIFKESISSRANNKPFVFYEGPPSANGAPGIHHLLGRTIKDVFCRYKTLKGYQVERKAGWDTHGLPVELGVEKEKGITKEDIGKTLSVEEYNQACRESVMRYTQAFNDVTKKLGYWVDMEHPYITYQPKYMESVWWLLKQIYNKKLLYKGYTIQPYSPKAGTGLSSHELNQPGTYKDVSDTTVVAQFRAKKETLPNHLKTFEGAIFFLAWTTTPWTLPSNTALAVGDHIDYVMVATYNQYTFEPINVILAKSLIEKQFKKKYLCVNEKSELASFKKDDKKIPYFINTEFKGKDLVDCKYEQLMDFALPYEHPENAFRVIAGDFVTTEDGTGIVHIAPTFGADDAKAAKEASPEVPPMLVLDDKGNPMPLVDLQGRFTLQMGNLAGKYVKNEYYESGQEPEKSVDVEIAISLKEQNKAFHVEKYQHSYPHCWRTNKSILYYPLDSWFVKVTEVRDRMFELNKTINWKPASTGEGRFGNWLKNANDWNLSRSRFWGIPLPIWRNVEGTEEIIIGSMAELKQEIKKSVTAGFMKKEVFEDFEVGNMSEENYQKIDLHKDVVDQIVLVSESGAPMKREPDLIDVWFDSGSMPYAQLHYPFENKETIDEQKKYPADFISEGVDQTRGWFYTLHVISTIVFDSVAYKNVLSNGLLMDKNGKKMSKSVGNVVDPFKTIEHYGADPTRWYMLANANPWENLKFDIEGIDEVRRKFFGTLHNTYSFLALYANLDQFNYSEEEVNINERPEIDRWILSELNSLIKCVGNSFEDYEPTKAARAIQEFTDEYLSNWFVRLSRRRFWKGTYGKDKIAAYQTLYNCMITISKLASPIAPFFMDHLYQDLNNITQKEAFKSVHLSDFPIYDEAFIDKKLEEKMQRAQKICSMLLSLRKKESIKVRQPLQRVMIPVMNDAEKEAILAVEDLIKSEVNVKEVTILKDDAAFLVKNIKPNFKVLGPKYGKEMGVVNKTVSEFTQTDIATIEKKGFIAINLNGKTIDLMLNEVEIAFKDIEGWLVSSQAGITVALDITITEDLQKEGNARELVNRIQNLRKEKGLKVSDRIRLFVEKDDILAPSILANEQYIKNETLTDDLVFEDKLENSTQISFDDVVTNIAIQKI